MKEESKCCFRPSLFFSLAVNVHRFKSKKFFVFFEKNRAPRYLKQNTYIFTLDNILRGVKKRANTRFRGYYCYFLTMN